MTTKKPHKDIAKVLNSLRKEFKDDNIVTLAKDMQDFDDKGIKRLPTGITDLDVKLGGGLPIGRIIHISGGYSSTKTTTTLHTLREAQKQDLLCALMDVENTTTMEYLESLGIDTSSLIYSLPSSLEECTQAMLTMQENGVKFIVWDSIAVSEPRKLLDSDMDDSVQMGVKQKLIGEFLGKFQAYNNKFSRNNELPCTLVMINQIREKIGAYGDAEYEPGGRAVGFYTSVHLRIRKGDWITEGKGDNRHIVGQEVKYKVMKNKTYKRMQTGEYDFYFDENSANVKEGYVDNFKSAIMLALDYNLIEQAGSFYYIDRGTEREVRQQGLANMIDFLRDNPNYVDRFKLEILEMEGKTN